MIGSASATGKITNDDSGISIVAGQATQNEGNKNATFFSFTVSRLSSTAGTATVTWSVAGTGTAPAIASDFFGQKLPSGSLTFAPGQTRKIITVSVNGDLDVEGDESFTVTLSNATGCEIQTASATGVIISDDAALSITALQANRPEGDAGETAFTFVVTRSGVTTAVATVDWRVVGAGNMPASSADFAGNFLPRSRLRFAAGEITQTITVLVAGDLAVERDEDFAIELYSVFNARLDTVRAFGVIRTDDTALGVTAAAAAINEGNADTSAFTFNVTRVGRTDIESEVSWSVNGTGSAPADAADFDGGKLPSGSVNFAVGETSKTISVLVAGDLVTELDERFVVTLSNAVGGGINGGTAIGVIRNDDSSLAISPSTLVTKEGNSGITPVTFSVTRSGSTVGLSTVYWAVAGSGTAPASGADFTDNVLPAGTITFRPGQTTARITVNVIGDRVAEQDEGFTVTLSAATGGVIQAATAVATIVNDDGPIIRPAGSSSPSMAAISNERSTVTAKPSATATAFAQIANSVATPNPYLRARRALR
jgi:hypothetical protein